MEMLETINRVTHARRFYIDDKRVSRDAFTLAEIAGRMRNAHFECFVTRASAGHTRHFKSVR